MKLDPNSREELPAVVRVAAKHPEWMTNPHLALQHAVSLIHAYNEGQPDEPSEKSKPTLADRLEDGGVHFVSGVNRVKPMPTQQDESSFTKEFGRGPFHVEQRTNACAMVVDSAGRELVSCYWNRRAKERAEAICALMNAKPMPTREEMVERAMSFGVYGRMDSLMLGSEVRALIDYILDGEAK